jgi:2-polyprenyl-3-methyl-5-hydroxy-6-metoxy-1,4-benzoquinol methylase
MLVSVNQKVIKEVVSTDFPEISSHFKDEMAIPTYLHSNPLIRWLFWKKHEVIAEFATIDSEDTVLDFGCGIGVFLPTLCHLAGKVYATDLFPQYAKMLTQQLGLKVEFIETLSALSNTSLDVIIAADVLEHLHDATELLGIFAAKLRPKGRLVVSGPTENSMYKLGRRIAGFGQKGDYHHTNIYQLTALIETNGYQAVKSTMLPFPLPFLPCLFMVAVFEKKM